MIITLPMVEASALRLDLPRVAPRDDTRNQPLV